MLTRISLVQLKLRKSTFKTTDTYKDGKVETERVWLDEPGEKLINFELYSAFVQTSLDKLPKFL